MVNEPWSLRPKVDGLSLTDLFMRRTPSQTTKNQEIEFSEMTSSIMQFGFHTGVIKDMVLSVNADNTRFDVSTGTAIKVDRSDPANVIVTKLTFSGIVAQLDTNLSATFSHVFIDPNTSIAITRTTPPNSLADLNNLIYVGTLVHSGGVIFVVLNNPIIAYGSSFTELTEIVLGSGVRVTGGLLSPNGANLQLDITDGIYEQYGRGTQFDTNNPNNSEIAGQTPFPVGNFVKVYIEAGGDLNIDLTTNEVNPALFNVDGLGTLVTVANNQFTVIRVFFAVSPGTTSRFVGYYGTEEFSSINEALSSTEPTFVEHEDTTQLSPVAKIAVRNNVTDLTAGLAAGTVMIQPRLRRI